MSRPEKLRLMEALWRDLAPDEEASAPPKWHGEVLADRERKLAAGKDALLDWETAKQLLRERLA